MFLRLEYTKEYYHCTDHFGTVITELRRAMTPYVSLVIPCHNEEQTVPILFAALNDFKNSLPKTEVILIDDGSSDQTYQQLVDLHLAFPKVVLKFSRNFGHQAALLAGLEVAKGKFVVTLDGDLQHPLSLIPQMLQHHENGIDIVLTKRIDTEDATAFKRTTSGLFYTLLNAFSSQKMTTNSSDFRSLNRRALAALLTLPEKRMYLRGMVEWIGFSHYVLPYKANKRVKGKSKYSMRKMFRLAVSGFTSFSTAPLYISTVFGLLLFLAALVYTLYVLYIRFVTGGAIQGWASVLFVQLTIGGFLCLFLGIIGLYLAAIYDEVKQRPLYIIAERHTDIT